MKTLSPESILSRMRKDSVLLCKKADLFIRYMLGGARKRTYLVTLWGSANIKIYYKTDIGKKGYHIVNQSEFIKKCSIYSRRSGVKILDGI